jgi:DivIVA domain-containing protein
VDGNEVRAQTFRLAMHGYRQEDVDALLDEVAFALDHQLSPVAIIKDASLPSAGAGYRVDEVDDFLARCANSPSPWPLMQATPGCRSLNWDAFSDLPGTHLSWRPLKRRSWELVSAGGEVWASLRAPVGAEGSRISARDTDYVVHRVDQAVWPLMQKYPSSKHPSRQWDVIASDGTRSLSWFGGHSEREACTRVELPDDRQLTFPTRRLKKKGVMMFAVAKDDDGHSLISYRLARGRWHDWWPVSMSMSQIFSVQIVVSAEALSIPQVALLVAVTSQLPWFYSRVGGGGG